mmetsp:Transcript_29108/g.38284  ORF Transcript_29108/g.38284 Transcript_29108/m.38284 type:complete len:112 (-) Transcript_29108:242-577(-)
MDEKKAASQIEKSQQSNSNSVLESIRKADFQSIPCLRNSLLCGITCGSMMILHRIRIKPQDVINACDSGIFAFTASSMISWYFCSKELKAKKDLIAQGMAAINIAKEEQKK